MSMKHLTDTGLVIVVHCMLVYVQSLTSCTPSLSMILTLKLKFGTSPAMLVTCALPLILTMSSLSDTLPQHVECLFTLDTLIPVLVHCTQTDVDSKTVSSVWYNCLGAEIIDPVQVRHRCRCVKATEKEVDREWVSRADRVCKCATNPG